MLEITVPARELWDEKNEVFVSTKEITLKLEHSLVSITKWEEKWHKPFLETEEKTYEETLDYIRCMTITQNVDPNVYKLLTPNELDKIAEYTSDPMTATWFNDQNSASSKRPHKRGMKVTAEVIYYWMISLNIPIEFQKWHLRKLLTLIRVCSEMNAPQKKMSRQEILAQNRALNAARSKPRKR